MKVLAITMSGFLVLSLCAATLAAPQQDRPGIITQPRVIIENRGRNEAIPVTVQEWAVGDRPTNVQIVGTPTVALASTTVVQARLVPQTWAYRTVIVPRGQDAATAVATAGFEGWETTGLQFPDPAGVSLLLKRPR